MHRSRVPSPARRCFGLGVLAGSLLLAAGGGCSGARRSGPPPVHSPTPPAVAPELAAAGATRLPPCPAASPLQPTSAGVAGTLRTPSGAFPLSGATVALLTPTGAPAAQTATDGCGRFQLAGVAPGPYTLRYGLRSLGGFAPLSLAAASSGGSALGLPLPLPLSVPIPLPGGIGPTILDPLLDTTGLQAGVVRGDWDHVELLLAKMGIPYVMYEADALKGDAPYQHRMLFIACGAASIPEQAEGKLESYVTGGGSLYASDLAIPYIGEVFEGAIEYDYSSRGDSGTRPAYVVDPELQVALRGAAKIDLTYDLGGWQRLAVNQPPGTLPLLRDVATNEPGAVTFQRGAGVVKYTTFHVEAQVSEAEETALVYMISRM